MMMEVFQLQVILICLLSSRKKEKYGFTNRQTPYPWSAATTNFVKPEKDKLVVYELLVRDFDAGRNYKV
jgi:hypothetical protein